MIHNSLHGITDCDTTLQIFKITICDLKKNQRKIVCKFKKVLCRVIARSGFSPTRQSHNFQMNRKV